MSKYGLLIDYEYCSGCHSCEIACRNEKDIALDDWGIKLASIGPWKRCLGYIVQQTMNNYSASTPEGVSGTFTSGAANLHATTAWNSHCTKPICQKP